jgi:hypothetical protein
VEDLIVPIYHRIRAHLPILFLFALLLALTKPANFGDTKWYARNLLAHQRGDFHESGSRLWEFGHLLLRPVGYVAYRAMEPWARGVLGQSDYPVAWMALVAVSLICSLILACLFQSLAELAGATRKVSFFVALATLACNGVLTFAPSGTSYIPGLTFLTWAVWLNMAGAVQGMKKVSPALWAGVALALSVLFWFPNAVSAASVLLVGLCWDRSDWSWNSAEWRQRVRWCLISAVTAAGTMVVMYAVAALALGMHSGADFFAWADEARHGWAQNRNLVRLVSGLPRGFVAFDSGLVFKRYLFHDPYAPVTRWDLVRFGIWKVGLFYAAALCLAASLVRSRRGRVALGLFVAGAAPVILFALYFEAGSMERYLAIYPFLVLALAVAFNAPRPSLASRGLIAMLIVIGFANVISMWRPAVVRDWSGERGRMQFLRTATTPNSQIWLLTGDRLFSVPEVFLFDRSSQGPELPLEEIAPIANEALPNWRKHFAALTLATWEHGGQVWMTKRILEQRPDPAWGWTEGDDPRISWKQLVTVATQVEIAQDGGGRDGFARLADTASSREYLGTLIEGTN